MKYKDFIRTKNRTLERTGFDVSRDEINPTLFDYQKDLARFLIRNGKAACFTMTGTGKTFIQIECARIVSEKTNCRTIIVAPLAVTEQTIEEGRKIGVVINNIRKTGMPSTVDITNYEQLHNIDVSKYGFIILDEASILKNYSGTTRNKIIEMFRGYKYKACFSATPSPNDYMELGNYSEFLDVMSRKEMLSTYFVHDSAETQTWRLKSHATDDFWRWFASFSAVMMYPSDIGYDDDRFILPPLIRHDHKIVSDVAYEGCLFPVAAKTLEERRLAKKSTIEQRVEKAASLVNADNDIWICWVNYNEESKQLTKAIPGAVEITGSDTDEKKERCALAFAHGEIKCLVTKPSIFGFGMNFQACHKQIFFPDDSFEQFFQAERRTYRFGQKHEVHSHLIYSNLEGNIMENLSRKEAAYYDMISAMIDNTKNYVKHNIEKADTVSSKYNPTIDMVLPLFLTGAQNEVS